MIVRCLKCEMYFDDEFRDTICPHRAFPANDGRNRFRVHEDAYLSANDAPYELRSDCDPECVTNHLHKGKPWWQKKDL